MLVFSVFLGLRDESGFEQVVDRGHNEKKRKREMGEREVEKRDGSDFIF